MLLYAPPARDWARTRAEACDSVRAAARQIREDSLRKNSLEMPDRGILSIRRGGVPSPSAENLSLPMSGGQSRFERKVKVAFRCGLPHGKFVKIACVKIHLKCTTINYRDRAAPVRKILSLPMSGGPGCFSCKVKSAIRCASARAAIRCAAARALKRIVTFL